MIRVVANLAWLIPGGVGGSEEYSVRLLEAVLDAAPADIDLGIVASKRLLAAHPALRDVAIAELGGPMHVRPYRVVVESTRVRAATAGVDVVHHFGGRVPARRAAGVTHVVTVHDLQPLHLPQNFSPVKRRYLRWAIPRSVQRADLVVTPSAWVADTVREAFGVAAGKVRPVSSTWDGRSERDDSLVAGLGGATVVLYPAVTHPHKQHVALIDAVRLLATRRPDVRLVLTGADGAAADAVARAAATAPVTRLGRLTAAQLLALIDRADVLAFPSTYEGFGLPVLEAMRARTPVVASSGGAVSEVLDGTGTLVESLDASAWAAAIEAALDAPADAVEAAHNRAAHYAPAAAADRLIDAWRAAAGSSTGP